MLNHYMPEGCLIGTAENKEFTYSEIGLEKAMAQGKILEGVVSLCDNSMNLIIDLNGIVGMMPKNEVVFSEDGEETKDIAIITRVGKTIQFKVTAITKKDGKTVAMLSRRLAQKEFCESFIMSLEAGDIIPCRVTHTENFGAFVDIGCGVVSLMPIDSISVSRISHPNDRFYIGMALRAVVKSVDYNTKRVYMSLKEMLGTWEENVADFQVGQTVSGIVRSVEDYGIFVELSPNLAGLAEYKENVAVGQTAAVYIKSIIPEKMKVKLVLVDVSEPIQRNRIVKYFINDDREHIDIWKYSPNASGKNIATIFDNAQI